MRKTIGIYRIEDKLYLVPNSKVNNGPLVMVEPIIDLEPPYKNLYDAFNSSLDECTVIDEGNNGKNTFNSLLKLSNAKTHKNFMKVAKFVRATLHDGKLSLIRINSDIKYKAFMVKSNKEKLIFDYSTFDAINLSESLKTLFNDNQSTNSYQLKKIIEIPECKNLVRIKDKLVYSKDKTLYECFINGDVNKEYITTDKISRLFTINNSIITTNSRGQILKIEGYPSVNTLGIHESKDLRISSVIQERYVRYYTRGESAISGFYDIVNKETVIESNEFFGRELWGEYLFGLGSVLKGIELKSGDLILEIAANSISKTAERFDRIICVRDNRVYIVMSDGCICSIDLSTKRFINWDSLGGKYLSYRTIHTAKPIDIYQSRFGSFSTRSATYLSHENKIVGFEYGVYWEIDLNDNSISVESMFDEFAANGISGCWSPTIADGNILFFVSDQSFHENQNHKLVGFDIKLKKVITQWTLPTTEMPRRGFAITGPVKLGKGLIAAFEQNSGCFVFNTVLENKV